MQVGIILISLGSLLLIGLFADLMGKFVNLPRVTLLIGLGVVIGPSGFDIMPQALLDGFPLIAYMALTMVAFLLGNNLSKRNLKEIGRPVFWLSISEVVLTALVVTLGLGLLGVDWPLAFLLGGISTATDPAATIDVVKESGDEGPFSRTLLGVVAIDDAWGLVVFSFMLALAQFLMGNGSWVTSLLHGGWELFGGVALGLLTGWGMGQFSKQGMIRLENEDESALVETLGLLMVCAGCAVLLNVSYLLAVMMVGVWLVNQPGTERPFRVLANFDWPFLVIFFILAGATLDPAGLQALGGIGLLYVLLRFVGRIAGGWVGSFFSNGSLPGASWMGLALMPQAGVALGMAIIAGNQIPEYKSIIYTVTLGATVFFELFGPVVTKIALRKADERAAKA